MSSPITFSNSENSNDHAEMISNGSKISEDQISADGSPSTKPKTFLSSRQSIRNSGSKSPEKCPICLSIPEDRAFTDSCYHEFCFVCLMEWSKVKSECPLCKQKFKNIVHNIRSIDDYDKYTIPEATESFGIDDSGRRFRFPTTMTVERVELLRLIRQLHLQLEEMQRNNQIAQQNRQMYMRQLARVRRLRHLFERSGERRERLTATSDFRRVVYERRLRAIPSAPGQRTRRCSPEFYNRHPACVHRLMPWLERELNVLLSGISGRVSFIMDLIRNLLMRWPIESPEFRRLLSPYIGQYLEAFLHELQNFARSSYTTMEEYDRHVQYESWRDARARLRGPDEAPPEIVLGSSPSPERFRDDDSDILDAQDTLASAHNPSPPPEQSWLYRSSSYADSGGRYLDRQAPGALLDRCQQLLEGNLMLLDARRDAENGRRRQTANLARQLVARERSWNATVQLTSSSDEDDSPRIDPTARTPPYLLPSRKRSMGSYNSAAAKRRRFLAGSSKGVHSSTRAIGGASSSIILEDDVDDSPQDEQYQESASPLLPASRSIESIVGPGMDTNSDAASRGILSAAIARSCLDGSATLLASSPSILLSPSSISPQQRSPALAFSPSAYSLEAYSTDHPSYGASPRASTFDTSLDSDDGYGYLHLGRSSPAYSFQFSSWNSHRRDYDSTPDTWGSGRRRDQSDGRDTTPGDRQLSPVDPDELQIVAELKPKSMRTPELVTLNDDGSGECDRKPNIAGLGLPPDDGPSTSDSSRRLNRSREDRKKHKHRDHKYDRHHHRHRHHHHGHKKERKRKEKRSKKHRERYREDSRRSPSPCSDEASRNGRHRSV